MAKQLPSASKNRVLMTCLAISCLIGIGWIIQSEELANWRDRVSQYIDNRDIVTLEARYLPEQLVDNHRQELLGNDKRTLQHTAIQYAPYLLLDIKYTEDQKSREGFLLWSLVDGEMILNTDSWESTHGFKDCLECKANRNDFKIIQAVARHGQGLSLEDLQKELKVEREAFEPWLEEAKQKHLIVQKGNVLQLHFENPKLLVTPQTRMKQPLVTKPLGEGQKIPRVYSRSQIIALAQAAFGSDFKIRNEQEIFLPIYKLNLLNPDGSIQISEWNALTGQRVIPRYLSNS
jgi:hypothetical protein